MKTASEKKHFNNQVNVFVKYHQKKQQELAEKKQRKNLTLNQVIKKSSLFSDDMIDVFLGDEQKYDVSEEVLEDIRESLTEMQRDINAFLPKQRFFVLETVNFFGSKIGIGKLIPALFILKGEDQKKAISEFVFPFFLGIDKNVETLVENEEVFDPKRLHMERGALYSFVADLSGIIIKLFKRDFIRNIKPHTPSFEFLQTGFDPKTFRFKKTIKTESKYAYEEMIDDEDKIRKIFLDFVVAIQSHEILYLYSAKRLAYYKLFLENLTDEDRFEDINPFSVSKILAGCLLANDQLKPDDDLIEKMINKRSFDDVDTLDERSEFIDELSPSNVYALINKFRVSLQDMSQIDFGDEFEDVNQFAAKRLIKNVWAGFIKLAEKGLIVVTEPVSLILKQVKKTYSSYIQEEEQEEEKLKPSQLVNKVTQKNDSILFIEKNLESFAIMSQYYSLVETNVIAFRSEHDGAKHTDFGYNTRFFRKDEASMVKFLASFRILFNTLKKNDKVREITFENQKKVREYYAAYAFKDFLVCLGLTHIQNPKIPIVDEKSIFPYILLFKKGDKKTKGRVLSREAIVNGNRGIYNEIPFDTKTAKFFYESVYLILHLIPEADWKTLNVQVCIAFLIRELNRVLKSKQKLLFCVEVPKI